MAKLNITMNKLFRDSLQYTSSDFVEVIDIILNITDSIGLEHSFLSEESVWPFVSNLIEHLY